MDFGNGQICGRLARDPQFFGEGDKERGLFTVAFNRGRGDSRRANFIDCVAWGNMVKIVRELSKGTGVVITGDIDQFSSERDGVKVSRVQINARTITKVSRRDEDSDGGSGSTTTTSASADSDTVEIPF